MKISNILIASTLVFTIACSGKRSESKHGHSYDTEAHEHSHDHDTPHDQEEFTIEGDSVEIGNDPTHHTHEDGSTHHDH